jgi:hypothetical protein
MSYSIPSPTKREKESKKRNHTVENSRRKEAQKGNNSYFCIYDFLVGEFFLLVVLGFELRASNLLGRYSIT